MVSYQRCLRTTALAAVERALEGHSRIKSARKAFLNTIYLEHGHTSKYKLLFDSQ